MGKLINGPFGTINGKIDNLVMYNLNGQNIIRIKALPSNKPPSIKQLNNRMQLKVLSAFLDGIDALLRTGFGPLALDSTKNFHNLAIHYNKPHALKGYYPDVQVDYSKIIFSKGNLSTATAPRAEWTTEGIKFSWENQSAPRWPSSEDQVMLLAYCPAHEKHFFNISGAKRPKGWDVLDIPAKFQNEQFELYISFVAHNRLDVADSQYMGLMTTAPDF